MFGRSEWIALIFITLLAVPAVFARRTERDVRIKAEFVGPVARIFCEQGFPGPRMSWGISSHINLPKLSVIKNVRLKYRKAKQLGLRNDRVGYHKKGLYSIQASIPRRSISVPTGKERLLFTAEAVFDIDQYGWINFVAPVNPDFNGYCRVELSIVEPRLVSEWALPRGLEVKELEPGKYVVKGKVKRNISRKSKRVSRSSRLSTKLSLRWRVKNFSKFTISRDESRLVGDCFRFNKGSAVVQLTGVPIQGKSTCLNVFVRGKAKHGALGKIHYSSKGMKAGFYSKELYVPREKVFDCATSKMGNVVIKNLGLHRQYLDFIHECKNSGELSDRSKERLKVITSSFEEVYSPLTFFTTYKPDRFKRISDDVISNVIDDLCCFLADENKNISVTESGWDILERGNPALNEFYEKSIKELRKHALKRDKKSSWFFGDEQMSKEDCKRQLKTLLGAIEMVCLDCGMCISTFHNEFTFDQKARLQFLRCVNIVNPFVANKGVNAYVAQLLFVRNNRYFTLPELSNLFWGTLSRQGYIHIPANSAKKPFYREFIIMPGFVRGDSKSEYTDFDIYCPLYELYTKDYR